MKRSKKIKIKKCGMLSALFFKTYPINKAMRYSISLFLPGIFMFIIAFRFTTNEISQNVISIVGTILTIFAIYSFPYFKTDKVDKSLSRFALYIFLFGICALLISFWLKLAVFGYKNIYVSIILTLLVAITLVPFINYTIKPLFNICIYISKRIKSTSDNTLPYNIWTNTKIVLSNLSIITSFLIALLSIATMINNFVS